VVRNSVTDCWGLTRRVVFVVAVGFVTELGKLVFSARERASSFGRTENGGMGGGNGLKEEVDGHVSHGVVAVDIEELAAEAVKAVEG